MKSKHTNGPWQAKLKRTMGDPMTPFLIYDIGQEDDPPLACVSNASVHQNPEELKANAHLMAAGPEMLAALVECAKQLRQLDCKGHAAVAEKAIAKAKGGKA